MLRYTVLCQDSEYAWPFYMFDRLLKMLGVLNNPGFWIWHSFLCKGYAEVRVCLIMAPYTSVIPEFASIFLDVPQMREHGWIILSQNMPENALINCSDMPAFSICCDIVTLTSFCNEFLSARFVHPGSLLPFIFIKHELNKNNKS